jgi:hypothetical protein
MFLAGRASAERERARVAGAPVGWAWPAALAAMTAVAGCLLVALVMRPRGDASPPAPSGPGSVAQETPRAPAPDRDEAPVPREGHDVPAVEPQRVFWPGAAESETWTVRWPRMDDADRTLAQLADRRFFGPDWESACPPGAFGPPVGPEAPRRPRSYVEHRRMLIEELISPEET